MYRYAILLLVPIAAIGCMASPDSDDDDGSSIATAEQSLMLPCQNVDIAGACYSQTFLEHYDALGWGNVSSKTVNGAQYYCADHWEFCLD